MAKVTKFSSGETIRLLDCDPVRIRFAWDRGVDLDAIHEEIMLVDDVWLAAVPTERACFVSATSKTAWPKVAAG